MKVLIVEDEDILREGLKKMVTRMNFPGAVVSTASNGIEALERVNKEHYDVIVTDICMPKMDGLEFLNRIQGRNPDLQTIILSGYDDFAYAKKAIHLGCRDYLLKPPSYEELRELLEQAFDKLKQVREQRLADQQEKSLSWLNRQSLRKEWLRGLLNDQAPIRAEKARAKARKLGVRLDADNYRLLLFCFDDLTTAASGWKERDWRLMKYAVSNIAQEVVGNGIVSDDEHDQLIMICPVEEDLCQQSALEIGTSVQTNVRHYLKLSLSCAVSGVHSLDDLPLAYQQCVQTMKYRFRFGHGMALTYDQVEQMTTNQDYAALYKDIQGFVESGALHNLVQSLQNICKRIEQIELAPADLEKLMGAWKLLLFKIIGHWAQDDQLPESCAEYRLLDMVSQEQVCYKQLDPALKLLNEIQSRNNRRKTENFAIEQAKQYIDENFCEPLTLQMIADQIYMNPAYFSVLFKKQVGISVTQYITEKRLAKARELMRQPEHKTYQIAEAVGFENAAYFSTIFKKYTGYTPHAYRNMVK